MSEVYIYILVMALTSFAIRVLPLTLIQTEIKNPLIKSFLYYVPYITSYLSHHHSYGRYKGETLQTKSMSESSDLMIAKV